MENASGGGAEACSTEFGQRKYHPSESSRINDSLQRKLTNDEVSMRPGPGGKKLTYIEHGKVVDIANHIFGFGGWSCAADSVKVDYVEKDPKNHTWSVGCHALVRVMLPNGSYHTDIGWGQADRMRNRGDAQEKAMKQAVSDGRKRALRIFGSRLGNSIYDKGHLEHLQEEQTKRQRVSNGHRPSSCAPSFNAPQNRMAKHQPQPKPQPARACENTNPIPNNSRMPSQMYGMKVVNQQQQPGTRLSVQKPQGNNRAPPAPIAQPPPTIANHPAPVPSRPTNAVAAKPNPQQQAGQRMNQPAAHVAPNTVQPTSTANQATNNQNYYDDGINDEALAALDI